MTQWYHEADAMASTHETYAAMAVMAGVLVLMWIWKG